MKKQFVFALALAFCFSNFLFAAPTQTTTDKKAASQPVLGQSAPVPFNGGGIPEKAPQPPVSGTGPAEQGNSLHTSVTVQKPCSNFEFAGDTILPVNRGDGYECPPGYGCKGVVGGFQCRWENRTNLTADSPFCRNTRCIPGT